jgi:hypothetical protein
MGISRSGRVARMQVTRMLPHASRGITYQGGGSAGRTDLESVKSLQDNPLLDQPIDGRCDGEPSIKASQIIPAQVVGHEMHDMRLAAGSSGSRRQER